MARRNTEEQRQEIKIGIIGPVPAVEQIKQTIKAFPTFKPVFKTFREEKAVPALAAELRGQVEVMLFSGPHPYQLAQEAHRFDIPVHYVPLKGTGLFRALYRLHKEYGLSSLSVDSVPPKAMAKTLKDLGEEFVEVSWFSGGLNAPLDDLVAFHAQCFREGRSGAALTGIHAVSEALNRLNIPNAFLIPTEQDITVALERALLATETRRSKESQVVFGFVNVDDFGKVAGTKSSEHEVQRLKLDVHRTLLGYVESLDGHLTHLGGDEYMFVTTRGIFERETGGYKSVPLAKVIDQEYGLSLSIGIGFGRSAGEAGMHARAALRHSKEAGGNFCFIVREDKSLIGPLEMTESLEYDLSLLDARMLKEIESAGLSLQYVSRLIGSVTRQGRTDYYAQELAEILGVTVRSTHRYLTAWYDAGLVEIVGETKGECKGRPRQIYRLSFLKDLIR
ncbi:hypothetical protein [Cohnella laeviribosi]|uniref:hypothetical protein n=1 Tax=Cohnella laeviribosi TaxID=380174 RepID=UPI000380599B|nr:hypothetical protein [Cohnella laeviribosi]